jgi:uncharacterized SAM-binding protein YcdF (DUF218 family)
LVFDAMEKFLVVDEEPKPADVIIVLGGGSGRVEYGVNLYHLGYADKILLTMGPGGWETTVSSLGVPKDDILLEEQARSTYENAKYSFEIMQANKFRSAVLVTSPYHTRRASMIFNRLFEGIELTICSVPNDSRNASKWWQDSHRAKAIASEYLKLVWCYLFTR